MFKATALMLLVVLGVVLALAECKPSEDKQHNRVARQTITDPLNTGISAAAQMAAAAAEAAQRAMEMGKQAMQGVARGAMGAAGQAAGAAQG
ncbi:hypothetical protein TSAR_011844 [Trichomalopsis sarcophagae]|uniref:Uncharacterized protein n=1 Tax=Trichomalopsis sarcophagae TaxID=543379 RepID=A0A232ERH7_9HYME|nr:hypothetical protein TSAR_011844 [Trichomalopsis sarcophagae]